MIYKNTYRYYLPKYTLCYGVVQLQFIRENVLFAPPCPISVDVDGWILIPPNDVANLSKSSEYRHQSSYVALIRVFIHFRVTDHVM